MEKSGCPWTTGCPVAFTYSCSTYPSICLGLVRAREADLLLNRETLRGSDARHRRIAAACGCADQNRGQHGRRRYQAGAALRRDAARDVALRDV